MTANLSSESFEHLFLSPYSSSSRDVNSNKLSKQEELEATKAQMEVPYYMFNIFLGLLVLILLATVYYFFLRERFICSALGCCNPGGSSSSRGVRSSADESHHHHHQARNSAEIQGSHHPQLNLHRSSNLTTTATTNTSSPRSILRASLTTTATLEHPVELLDA